MKKFKVTWYEEITKGYSAVVEADSASEAKELIDDDVNDARTSVTEADYEEVSDWDIIGVHELE